MSRKRRNTSSEEPEEFQGSSKRQRPSWVDDFGAFEHPDATELPRIDASCGQQEAFPGLDDGDDELIYGDPEDGLQYLRMVRSERKNYPHVLVADTSNQNTSDGDEGMHEEDNYDQADYHPDRAWIAAPDNAIGESLEAALDIQDLYHDALLEHFTELQTRLRTAPPLSAVELLTSSRPISFPPDAPKAKDKWRNVTTSTDPDATQLACMDPESLMELVKLLTASMNEIIKSRVQARVKRLGSWIWATLGRCRDRGELSSEEIAELRLMGKKAVQLLNFTRRSESMLAKQYPESYIQNAGDLTGSDADNESVYNESDLEQRKARLASMLDATGDEAPSEAVDGSKLMGSDSNLAIDFDKQTRMLLDTIITLVGEVYGQRDLLDHRDIWD